ncbi:MAG TPA: DegT/DnrJ/EryC1/StrS family aminotransferase [Caulobacteraceae bacterium]|jgi:dTDP-4-amino-4,6-dideoxygalactose transaminase
MPTPPSPIQFIDLKAQQARIRDRVEARFQAVLDHGAYINGPEVRELEAALCEFTGAQKALAVSNGTDALVMPMMAMELGASDAVFIPAFTYNATASAVILAGATPVFVDVRSQDFNLDPEDLDRRIEQVKREGSLTPRLVIAVDLFGIPADYEALFAVAQAHGVEVLADAAQSFGARWNGRWAGDIAPVTATSFFPAKALGCYGDGGAVFFRDTALYEACEQIRWHGTDAARKESVRVGFNGRLDSLQCAVVAEKLRIFSQELERRRAVAAIYDSRLANYIDPQAFAEGAESGYGLYTVAIDRRDEVQARLREDGVPTAVYYPQPLHRMRAFQACADPSGYPQSERLAERVLSLPMHPYLTDEQAHYVCDRAIAG